MLPIVALVGRPNVGKSTLFNVLTRTRDALVYDKPGVTRDRISRPCEFGSRRALLVDTAGVGGAGAMELQVGEQIKLALHEANVVLWLVDARDGVLPDDEALAKLLRQLHCPCLLVVNKTDGLDQAIVLADFYRLGIKPIIPIASSHRIGIDALSQALEQLLPVSTEPTDDQNRMKMVVAGRPNVGKSTLVNTLLGFERVVVFDAPGTTRDSVYVDFERDGQCFTLIDTAGVRRRARVSDTLEKFSVLKTLQALDDAHVAIYLVDGQEGVMEQDLHLLSTIEQSGCALVLAVNKWDGLSEQQKKRVRASMDRRLGFVSYAEQLFISAKLGRQVGPLFRAARRAFEAGQVDMKTSQLTRIMQEALAAHPPPRGGARRVKLRYAHPGGSHPPTIVLHGNQTDKLSADYKRYLQACFRQALGLRGVNVRLIFKTNTNPYHDGNGT